MSLGAGFKEGATGASIGTSIFPGVGTAIGGGIGFLHGLFGGGGDDDDKAAPPAGDFTTKGKFDPDKAGLYAAQGLKGQAEKNAATGAQLGGMSQEALAPVLNYFKSIASGDPGALMAATQPERGRVIDQYDAARKAASVSAPRGGGTTSAITTSYISEANQLSDLTATAHREGNTTLANLGVNLAGLGLSADQLASSDLDSIIQAVFAQKGIDSQKRGQNLAVIGDIGEAIGTVAAIIAGGD